MGSTVIVPEEYREAYERAEVAYYVRRLISKAVDREVVENAFEEWVVQVQVSQGIIFVADYVKRLIKKVVKPLLVTENAFRKWAVVAKQRKQHREVSIFVNTVIDNVLDAINRAERERENDIEIKNDTDR